MDLYPLYNSIRIAFISTIIVFFVSIYLANCIVKIPRAARGVLDVFFTLPLVLPPTVIGYLLLRLFGPKRLLGKLFLEIFNLRWTMNWWSAILSTTVVIFPLMYRTIRSSFEAYDKTYSECSMDLGANRFITFFLIKLPICKEGLIAGTVLSFARALGEFGATSMICGYTPGKTATIATTVYQLWRINDDYKAMFWVIINMVISSGVLLLINFFEKKQKKT